MEGMSSLVLRECLMSLKLGPYRNCPDGVYQIYFQCSMRIKLCSMGKKFPNFSILLGFVTVASFLSKHWCFCIFSNKISKGQKITTINEILYWNYFKEKQPFSPIIFFSLWKNCLKFYFYVNKKFPEMSQDKRQRSKPQKSFFPRQLLRCLAGWQARKTI